MWTPYMAMNCLKLQLIHHNTKIHVFISNIQTLHIVGFQRGSASLAWCGAAPHQKRKTPRIAHAIAASHIGAYGEAIATKKGVGAYGEAIATKGAKAPFPKCILFHDFFFFFSNDFVDFL
jgi:hypothetical protein